MFRNLLLMGLLTFLFGCGDGKPGFFSSNGYHVNKEKVWYKSSVGMDFQVSEVVGADPATFAEKELSSKVMPGTTAYYGMDKSSIFWTATKIEGADLQTFEYLCNNYSRDKNAVYYMAGRLTEDLAHFVVIDYEFVKDAQYVYNGGSVFSDDPAHFTLVGGQDSRYYKDSRSCWYGSYKLEGADPATFRYLGPKTAADARHIYHEMNEIDGADQHTYQILEHEYAKDAHHVYKQYSRLEGADPATFRVLSSNYSQDKRYCYYFMSPLPDADPLTFQLIDEFYAKDAQRVYTNGKVLEGADPATFRVLNGPAGCSCDAHYAYSMSTRIEGVDPKSFPAGKPCISCNETEVKF